MSAFPSSADLSLAEAIALLRTFNCTAGKVLTSPTEKAQVRQALLQVGQHSDYQILGICAETEAEGHQALYSYAQALGYAAPTPTGGPAAPLYLKFNPKTSLCYQEGYSGHHRGVLVSCQSAEETDVNEMFGHLPLDLFADSL